MLHTHSDLYSLIYQEVKKQRLISFIPILVADLSTDVALVQQLYGLQSIFIFLTTQSLSFVICPFCQFLCVSVRL